RVRDVDVDVRRWEAKRRRHHANDLVRIVAEFDAPANGRRRSAKLAAPEGVAQHDESVVRPAHHLVVARHAAASRRDAKRIPEPWCHERRGQSLRLTDALEVGSTHALAVEVAADVGEGVLSRTPVVEIYRRDDASFVAAVRRLDLPEANDAIGLGEG